MVEFACGIPHLLKGEFSENVGTGIDAYSLRQPLGVCAGITPFNFPGHGAAVDVPGGARLRQHFHPEALGESAGLLHAAGGIAHRSRRAARRVQHRQWREGNGRCPARASRHRRHQLRRLHAGRRARLSHRHAGGQTRAGAGRREEPHGGPARCRSRPGGGRVDGRGLWLGRRTLHGDIGRGRRRRGRRSADREARAESARAENRPRHRQGIRNGPAGQRRPSRQGERLYRSRRARKAPSWWSTAAISACRATKMASSSAARCSTRCGPDMRIYKEEIFGPVLAVVRAPGVRRRAQARQRPRIRQRRRRFLPATATPRAPSSAA